MSSSSYDTTPLVFDSDDSGNDAPDRDYSHLSEAAEIKSWDECKDYKMPLGKHAGACISTLMTLEGLDYLEYLSRWEELSAHTGSYVKYALAHGLKTHHVDPIEANTWVMPFGKYKGKPLCKIATRKKGPSYIKWLSTLSKPGISLRAKAVYSTISGDQTQDIPHTPVVKVKRTRSSAATTTSEKRKNRRQKRKTLH